MRTMTLLILFLSQMLRAQQVVAPTPAQVGPARGENKGDYNITNSFETGYRFTEVGGNRGVYRSDVNYGNGPRVLGTSLTVNSKDGHGKFFDEIVLSTLGLGNDPYESARFRIQKNSWYDYNLLWRLNDYYNPALNIALGEHFMNTRRMLQDHELTLLPRYKLEIHFGYSNNNQNGPALTTQQLFDTRSAFFPLFADVRRSFNEYRLGADYNLGEGIRLTVQHRWSYFKDDTPLGLDGATTNPFDAVVLSTYRRVEPTHGSNGGWLGNIIANKKWWSVNGRFVYTGGQRRFVQDESTTGLDRIGNNVNRLTIISGNANRPFSTGNFSLSVFPGDRFTLVNHTSFYNQRIDGNSSFLAFNNFTNTADVVSFHYLGIRTVSNATDLHYKLDNWLSVYGGYHYATRRIQTIAGFALPGSSPDQTFAEEENHQNVGAFGFRLRPLKPVTINLDAEIGRTDRAYTPLSDKNYHALSGRGQYKARRFLFTAGYRQKYNNNSVTLTTYSSRSRDYLANVSWNARDWFALDAGYSKLHLDTVGGITFFANIPRVTLVQGQDSVYVSNVHSANLGARAVLKKRVDVYAGYTISRDTGDGRSQALRFAITDPLQQVFLPVQTFPLSYQSPLARVSVRLSPKLRWNVGWQFYNYHEDFGLFASYQNYHAHTGYTSVLWSF